MTPRKNPPLNNVERTTLKAVARVMIPACKSKNLPGADDDIIFDDILTSLDRDTAAVAEILRKLHSQAGGDFEQLTSISAGSILYEFSTKDRANAAVLEQVIAQCYYRDERVMKAINIEPRAPYPNGYTLMKTNWDLLEPVRGRGKIFRDISS